MATLQSSWSTGARCPPRSAAGYHAYAVATSEVGIIATDLVDAIGSGYDVIAAGVNGFIDQAQVAQCAFVKSTRQAEQR